MVLRKIPGKGFMNKIGSFGLVVCSGLIHIGETQIEKIKKIDLKHIQEQIYQVTPFRKTDLSINQKAAIYSEYLKQKNKLSK